uniref:Uncharacterized protein n=1 Tax=Arundo donax TaxID=35708 RepID=A0A0A9GHL1_ARUDO
MICTITHSVDKSYVKILSIDEIRHIAFGLGDEMT